MQQKESHGEARMSKNESAILAIKEACQALKSNDIEKSREIIKTKYPHIKPLKKRKSFNRKEQIKIFMRDGFIDRYSGNKLLFPGVLGILSYMLPDVFPLHENWKADECHQAWWDLFPSIDHVIPISFGGTNKEDNLVCTSMKNNLAKSTSTLEEIGWTLKPPGKIEEWDGLIYWFQEYMKINPQLLENDYIKRWYDACSEFVIDN